MSFFGENLKGGIMKCSKTNYIKKDIFALEAEANGNQHHNKYLILNIKT